MTRVAIVDWYPRICGATDFGLHLAAGAGRDVEIDLVTFSRSGRSLKDFAHPARWKVYRVADAVAVLNAYDLVVLTDVACFAPQVVKRGRERPYYLDIVEKLTTPFTSFYHGGPYPSKYDDAIGAVLNATAFTGVLGTTRAAEARPRLEPLCRAPIGWVVHPFLPYDLITRGLTTPSPKRVRAVVMTARIAVNKGQNAILGLLPKLAGHVNVWGYNAFGLPSIGWRLWELGQALGYKVITEAQLREDATKLTHPRARRFYTGRYEFAANRARYRYHRAYTTLDEIDWSPIAHVSLANDDFKGTLEYVSLDAIAAWVIPIVPEHAVEYARGRYGNAVVTVPYTRSNLWARSPNPADGPKGEIVGDVPAIVDRINGLLDESSVALERRAAAGREALETLHSPKKIFSKLIKEALRA